MTHSSSFPPIDRRLQDRFMTLVQSHMRSAPHLASGVAIVPGHSGSFAAVQGAWRFLNNKRVTLPALAEPMRALGKERAAATNASFLLLAHDWCKLNFANALNKDDLVQLTHETDIGYELTTALLISGDNGDPLAPMEIHMKTGKGVWSTRAKKVKDEPHLDQVLSTMEASITWNLPKPLIHVIDREADSVDRYRTWDAAGHKFLVRGDDRRVRWNDQSLLLTDIYQSLRQDKQFHKAGRAAYHGRRAFLWVSETEVILDRPAKKSINGKKSMRRGRPISLRFIAVEVRDAQGKILAHWFLLSNVPHEWTDSICLAHCYYWRWRIENFFKLLKSHGQQLERWQQKTGSAIARRLLIASMACVLVWQLQADTSPAACKWKDILIRLSGRQMKRSKLHTAPALLAGLWILLSMTELMEQVDLASLQELVDHIPYLHRDV